MFTLLALFSAFDIVDQIILEEQLIQVASGTECRPTATLLHPNNVKILNYLRQKLYLVIHLWSSDTSVYKVYLSVQT